MEHYSDKGFGQTANGMPPIIYMPFKKPMALWTIQASLRPTCMFHQGPTRGTPDLLPFDPGHFQISGPRYPLLTDLTLSAGRLVCPASHDAPASILTRLAGLPRDWS